jgi:hypothetical protein
MTRHYYYWIIISGNTTNIISGSTTNKHNAIVTIVNAITVINNKVVGISHTDWSGNALCPIVQMVCK